MMLLSGKPISACATRYTNLKLRLFFMLDSNRFYGAGMARKVTNSSILEVTPPHLVGERVDPFRGRLSGKSVTKPDVARLLPNQLVREKM
jgi:hypothetical protein